MENSCKNCNGLEQRCKDLERILYAYAEFTSRISDDVVAKTWGFFEPEFHEEKDDPELYAALVREESRRISERDGGQINSNLKK